MSPNRGSLKTRELDKFYGTDESSGSIEIHKVILKLKQMPSISGATFSVVILTFMRRSHLFPDQFPADHAGDMLVMSEFLLGPHVFFRHDNTHPIPYRVGV